MPRHWKLKDIDEQSVREIAGRTGMPIPLARALALRGHHDPDETEAFLNPRLADLSDPGLLPDMQKAVSRIRQAIDTGETISVFGDYDVDGVTSTAVLTRILSALGADVKSFIPDRLDEGYGLSYEALERCLEEHGSTLVITVDCGTNSVDSVTRALARQIDIIVTDHHEPDEQTAPAFAVINPKLACPEPHQGKNPPSLEILSGAGVAFKLAHALLKAGRADGNTAAEQVNLRDYFDIVALGTVADIVPLIDENRIIVRHGLNVMNATRWEGLRALKAVAGIHGDIETYHLAFQLGPRINAAGRIGQPMQALRLLVTDDAGEARRIAQLLNETNTERRRIEKEMAEAAFSEIDEYFDPEEHFGLVVAKEGWHPGVVGIVASRISKHYNRPAIVMGIDKDGHIRGSCRSIDEFDILEGLRACDRHLIQYGGHRMAAGVELPADSLETFRAAFNAAASSELKPLDLVPVLPIDAEVSGRDIDWNFLEKLKRLHPFGQDNPEPVWALCGIDHPGNIRVVGQNHLKFSVASSGRKFEAIAFNYSPDRLPGGKLDIAFTLKENNWNGSTNLQLQIKDIRAAKAETD